MVAEPRLLRGAAPDVRDALLQLLAAGLLHTMARAEELGAAGPAGVGEEQLGPVPDGWALRNVGKGAAHSRQLDVDATSAAGPDLVASHGPLGFVPGPWVEDVPIAVKWMRGALAELGSDVRGAAGSADPFERGLHAARQLALRELRRAGVRRGAGAGAGAGEGGAVVAGGAALPLSPPTVDLVGRAMSEALALRARFRRRGGAAPGRGGAGAAARAGREDGDAWAGAREHASVALSGPILRHWQLAKGGGGGSGGGGQAVAGGMGGHGPRVVRMATQRTRQW